MILLRRAGVMLNCFAAASTADFLSAASTVPRCEALAVNRSPLGSSNFLEHSPECVLYGYASSIPVEYDAPFRDRSPVRGSRHRRLFQSHHHDLDALRTGQRGPPLALPISSCLPTVGSRQSRSNHSSQADRPRQSIGLSCSFQFGRTSTRRPPHLLHLARHDGISTSSG